MPDRRRDMPAGWPARLCEAVGFGLTVEHRPAWNCWRTFIGGWLLQIARLCSVRRFYRIDRQRRLDRRGHPVAHHRIHQALSNFSEAPVVGARHASAPTVTNRWTTPICGYGGPIDPFRARVAGRLKMVYAAVHNGAVSKAAPVMHRAIGRQGDSCDQKERDKPWIDKPCIDKPCIDKPCRSTNLGFSAPTPAIPTAHGIERPLPQESRERADRSFRSPSICRPRPATIQR